jgi:hypothetical protein
MQATTKPSVPTSPTPARSPQQQPGPAPSKPQPIAPDLLDHVSGAGGPGRNW